MKASAECWAKAVLIIGLDWAELGNGRAIKRGYQDVYAGESHPHFMAPYAHTGGNADIISLSASKEDATESSSG